MIEENSTEDRILKAKIKVAYSNPFFAYLSFYLTIKEDTSSIIPKDCGMAVTPKGHLYYRKKFVDEITDAQLLGVLVHEICHLALLHLVRCGKRNFLRWNIACDLVVNTMLLKNGYELPRSIKPNSNNQFIILNKTIDDVDIKSSEEIYDELPEIPEQKNEIYNHFDSHEKGEEGEGETREELTESELQELENEWINKVQIAMNMAQERGPLPLGLERHLNKLKTSQINWRNALRRFIQQIVPVDYSWSRPSKKSVSCGCYLPHLLKEKINIVVSVDVSGSIDEEGYMKFISEIIGIAKTFREIIDMRIIFHDAEVQCDYLIKNGNIPKIMAMTINGGGGTEFNEIAKYINDKYKTNGCVIWFTDGHGNQIKEKTKYPILWIIDKNGTDKVIKNRDKRDKIIWLKENK